MRIAVYQTQGVAGDTERAIGRMRRIVRKAAAQGVGLVIFPEMFLSGYNTANAVHALAEPAGGPSAATVKDCTVPSPQSIA